MQRRPINNERPYISVSTAFKCGETSSSIPKSINVSLEPTKVGNNILFSVIITNTWPKEKELEVHINAQNKSYNQNPKATFWKADDYLKIAPCSSEILNHKSSLRDNCRIKLSVYIRDIETGEEKKESEEFYITMPSPSLQMRYAARRDRNDDLLAYSKHYGVFETPAHHSAWVQHHQY